jgi:Tfp pilus assembly protein PilN
MPNWFWISLWSALGVGALIVWLIVLVRLAKRGKTLQTEAAPLRESSAALKAALEQQRILIEKLKSKDQEGKD